MKTLILSIVLSLSSCIVNKQQTQEQMEETLNIITEKQYTAIKEMAKVNHRWFVGNTECVLTYSYTGEDIILDVGASRFYKIKLNTELSGKAWQALFIGYESYIMSKRNQ